MNNNIILEMRQQDSNKINANGDYEIELAKEITINEGDIIQMKQSFIDVTNSDQIQIPYDLTISTEHILYFTDWIVDTNKKGGYINSSGTAGTQGQGFSFVPFDYVTGAPIVGYDTYDKITWKSTAPNTFNSIPFVATFAYIDITNTTLYFQVSVDSTESGFFFVNNISYIAKTGSLRLVSPNESTLKQNMMEFSSFSTLPTPPIIDNYYPYIFTTSFSLPAGSYDPLDLSLYISEQLSKNQINELSHSTKLVNSPFLKVASDFNIGAPYPNSTLPTPPKIVNKPYFICTDGLGNLTQIMQFIASSGYFIGSSQIAMEYNAQTQKFNWTYLHFPQYDDVAGNQISVNYIPVLNDKVMAIAKNGGVCFTGLSAVVTATGVPFDFWAGVLGFNLDTLVAKPQIYFGGFAGLTGKFTYYNVIDGVNTTNGFVGLDSAIVKKKDLWYAEQPITPAFSSTIDTTINIVAQKSFSEIQNKFSHFLLSCSLQYTVDYVGSDNYFNIQGIINKYMSYGAYVYSSSDGAIQYQHTGAPITLKSIGIRLLKSDKTKDITLGPDNTIIFEIVKSSQQNVSKK